MASFAVEEEVKVAKQVEFDAVVGQLMEEGALLEDAVSETLEILEEDGQDLDVGHLLLLLHVRHLPAGARRLRPRLRGPRRCVVGPGSVLLCAARGPCRVL